MNRRVLLTVAEAPFQGSVDKMGDYATQYARDQGKQKFGYMLKKPVNAGRLK